MPNRDNRTYKAALRAQAKVTAARQELMVEEPMHRYPHPIPMPMQSPEPDREKLRQCQTLTQILEQLQTQSQLLVDLNESLNGLAAALLSKQGPAGE